jgi:hypothetical protein
MASTSEVGHAKNVANFNELKAFVIGYGEKYKPSNPDYELAKLEMVYTESKSTIVNVTKGGVQHNKVLSTRAEEFKDVSALSTRLVNALESSKASERTIKNAKTYLRKIRGARATKKAEPQPGEPAPVTISTSQRSFDQMIEHFSGIKSVLESEPSYMPNEEELTLAATEQKRIRMTDTNEAVAVSDEKSSNQRLQRDRILYTNPDSTTNTAAGVKKYVISLFGARSPEYKQISGIKFTVIKP